MTAKNKQRRETDNDEMRGFFAALRMTNENYVQNDGEKKQPQVLRLRLAQERARLRSG
jgi:hypothetical protein